jgi:hypothetical protein
MIKEFVESKLLALQDNPLIKDRVVGMPKVCGDVVQDT